MVGINYFGNPILSGGALRRPPRSLTPKALKQGEYVLGDDAPLGNGVLQGMLFNPGDYAETHEERMNILHKNNPVSLHLSEDQEDNLHGESLYSEDPDQAYENMRNNYEREAGGVWKQALAYSRIPRELLTQLHGKTSIVPSLHYDKNIKNDNGIYHPTTGEITQRAVSHPDYLGVSVASNSDTALHETGHRADFRSLDSEGAMSIARRKKLTDVGGTHPNPRAEGIADGFVDRYGTQEDRSRVGEFHHFKNTGYSTSNSDWQEDMRAAAVYAASRAHFTHTGENPTGEDYDEYLHKMLNISPHAVAALQQTGLEDVAKEAAERYKGTRVSGRQLSLFGPSHEYDLYDIPDSHKK